MDRDSSHNLFEGKNRVSAILITLFLSFFAIAMFYVLYRQFDGTRERPGIIDPWHNTLAHMFNENEKPILWDVYIGGEKLDWEWGGFKVSERFGIFRVAFSCGLAPSFRPSHFTPKWELNVDAFIRSTRQPLSVDVFDTPPTPPWTQKRWQGFSKEEEEKVHVSTIIVFPSQRKQKPGHSQGGEVEDYAIGIAGARCEGLTPIQ